LKLSVFVGLGGNLGGELVAAARLRAAAAALSGWPDVAAARGSALYRTAPVGPVAAQPAFVNGVVRLAWRRPVEEIDAAALLSRLLDLERALGGVRDRTVRDGPRQLDLDLLLIGERLISAGAIVPHPRIGERAFVLVPLIELCGGATVLPGDGRTLAACLAAPAVAAQEIVRLPYTLFS